MPAWSPSFANWPRATAAIAVPSMEASGREKARLLSRAPRGRSACGKGLSAPLIPSNVVARNHVLFRVPTNIAITGQDHIGTLRMLYEIALVSTICDPKRVSRIAQCVRRSPPCLEPCRGCEGRCSSSRSALPVLRSRGASTFLASINVEKINLGKQRGRQLRRPILKALHLPPA